MFGALAPKETVDMGVTRQLFGYDDKIMMARVEFEDGAPVISMITTHNI